jgi:2-iminobutanoate/2-iminopropanoate deaminase
MGREVVDVAAISDISRKRGIPISAAVKANGFVFVSGMPPIDVEGGGFDGPGVARQTERCLRNIAYVLEQAGTSLEKVCMMRVYADAKHYAAINEVYARFFPIEPPARTFVPVGAWPMDFDIEIDCVALQ